MYSSLQTFWTVCIHWRVGHKLGRQQSGTVSWVPSDELGAHHPLSPVIYLSTFYTRNKETISDHGWVLVHHLLSSVLELGFRKIDLFYSLCLMSMSIAQVPLGRELNSNLIFYQTIFHGVIKATPIKSMILCTTHMRSRLVKVVKGVAGLQTN